MPTVRNGRLLGAGTADLHFSGERIVAEPADDEVIDAQEMIVAPGFIDIQINGGFGHDFTQDPTTIWAVGQRLPELGVTSFVPTVVTSPLEVYDLALDVVQNRKPPGYSGADVVGLHFEGPWISPAMHGAHNAGHIVDPSPETARRWAESGNVSIVTLAPERDRAADVGDILASNGIVVSVGHTAADYGTASSAFGSYATLTTHLFNQMTPMSHREPGVVGAALLSNKPCILIVDGLHISEPIVEMAWRLLGEERFVLVTDAMAALGLGHGTYPLGDGPITVGDDGPRTADGRLAGSVVTLPEAVANFHRATSASVSQSLLGATANPARVLGLDDRGTLEVGNRADLVVFDEHLRVSFTLVGGQRPDV